jgi:TolB protein
MRRRPKGTIAAALLALLLGCLAPAPARAILYIDINAPGGHRMPVALPDFVSVPGGHALRSELPRIIAADLEMTGLFDVIPAAASLERVVPSHFTGTALSFPDWKILGAEAVVIGKLDVKGEQASVEMRLYDATMGKLMAGKRYQAPVKRLRTVAHRFANEILHAFTGQMGIFDTEIAFSARPGEGRGKEIYVVGIDGQDLRQVTSNRSFNLFPKWSPDGVSIAYTSFRTGQQELYLRSLRDGRERLLVKFGNTKTAGCFSPDGKFLYAAISVAGNSDIYRLPLAGGEAERVIGGWGLEVSPTVSPDGKKMAFVSNRSGSPQVYVKDLASGSEVRVSSGGSYSTSPAWSPAGDRIAYTAGGGGGFAIYTVKPDGTEQAQIAAGNGDCEDPSYSPDGRYLVYSHRKKSYSELCLISADGRWKKVLFSGLTELGSPSWSPRR